MLTPDQLAAIKALEQATKPAPWYAERMQKYYRVGSQEYPYLIERLYENIDAEFIAESRNALPLLITEVERLTRHNQRMSAALAQLSDAENWLEAIGSDNLPSYIWLLTIDPQQLAERALVEDG